MQSNPESFSWYLKNLEKQSSAQMSETELEIKLLRIVKLLSPIPVGKFIEISQPDLSLPVLKVSEILERLEKRDELTISEDAAFGGQKVVRITQRGLTRLKTEGAA